MPYRFGEFELDRATYELRRGGFPVHIQAKVFELLCYLIEGRGRLVPREELLGALWTDVHVSDSALAWCVSQARKALGQDRTATHPIETLHGRGYRFRADVRVTDPSDGGANGGVSTEAPPALRSEGQFIGRGSAMDTLRGALDRARRLGTGSGLVLMGEAGIGKTRCASELAAEARSDGTAVWLSQCHEGEGAPVLWPWIQILRECIASSAQPAPVPSATDLLAALVPESGDLGESALVDGRRGTFWLLDGIVRCVLAEGQVAPRLVIVDDLQWADELSLRALELLAPALPNSSIVLVATLRSTDEPIAESNRSSLGRLLRRLTPIGLTGLSRGELAEYVQGATGVAPSAGLIDAVLEKTAGNPLFVGEIVRQLASLPGHGAEKPSEIETPRIARDLIQVRLNHYGLPVRRALEAASILGETFELPVLAAMLGALPEELLRSLEIGVRAGLLAAPMSLGRYSFAHALVRDAVNADISDMRRHELHSLAGEALEARALNDEQVSRLAFHFHQALPLGGHGKAVRYSMRAARASNNMFAYHEAKAHWTRAFEAMGYVSAPDGSVQCQVLLGLATSELRLGLRSEGQQHLEQSIDVAKRLGLGGELVAVGRALRHSISSPMPPNRVTRDALEAALSILSADDAANRAGALSHLAAIAPSVLSMDESRRLSSAAIDIARPLGSFSLLEALWSRLFSLTGPDDIDELLEVTSEMLALEAQHSFLWSGEAYYVRFCAHLYRGSMYEAALALEGYGAVAHRKHSHEAVWAYDRLRAQLLFQRGEFARAESMWMELAERGDKSHSAYERTVYQTHAIQLGQERGTPLALTEETKSLLRTWLSKGPRHRERARAVVATFEEGRIEEARESFEALVRQGFSWIPKDLGYLATLSSLSVAAIQLGDKSRADQLYACLRPYPHHSTPDRYAFTMGSASHYLGLLADFLERPGAAREHFEVALRRNEEMGLRPSSCRTLLAYAAWLSSEEPTLPRWRELAVRALQIAEELGMRSAVNGARALLASPRARTVRS